MQLPPQANSHHANTPLCVDLDGTLIKTDVLYESLILLLKKAPYYIFYLPFWLLKGRAYLKQKVANNVDLDVTKLPYCSNFLTFLKKEQQNGRKLLLITAADQKIAAKVNAYLNIFTEVIASDGQTNMRGRQKRLLLNRLFGKKQYDYAGNSKVDLAVWTDARYIILVNANTKTTRKAHKIGQVLQIF